MSVMPDFTTIPTSTTLDRSAPPSTVSNRSSHLDQIKTDFAGRIERRTDLSDFDRSTVFHLGTAILDCDFLKLQAIVKSYLHFAEQFARIAYVLAAELRCPEVSILKVSVLNWKASAIDCEHKICIITLRLDRIRRFIDIATDPIYGVSVFGPASSGMAPKLSKLNEDPRIILKMISATELEGRSPVSTVA